MSTLKLTLISDPSKFRAGMAAASKDLKKFQYTANQASRAINRAMGAAGVGIGFAKLAGFIKNAGRAAAEDVVSQRQLALALKNTTGANGAAIQSAEAYIQKVSNQVAILDDNLRPALAAAVRATGSLSKGQELLNVALDVSAGTGKDLGQVTKAIARAQQGQLGGLQRLIPGIKTGTDVMEQLKTQFKGAAKEAANNNPYQRIQVIFDNLKETIGKTLLPAIQQFADYLASPDGEKTLQAVADILSGIGTAFVNISKWLVHNIGLVKGLALAFIVVKGAIGGITFAMKMYDLATKFAAISTKALKWALISTGIGALAVLVGTLAENWMSAQENQKQYFIDYQNMNQIQYLDLKEKQSRDALSNRWQNLGKFFKKQKQKLIDQQTELNKELAKTGVKFRDAVGLAFGTAGQDEYSVFNADMVINKLKRIVNAAKGFKQNLDRLRKQGAGADVINELINMGPAQGNIVAKGLLQSGRLSEYLALKGSLYKTGINVAGTAMNTREKTYQIEIKEQNATAQAIISAIRAYEKKTGRKYFVAHG